MGLILFLAGFFLFAFIIGRLLEKIKIPWIFSALLIGLGLAAYNPFSDITSSDSFTLFAQLGMYFLLFIIGFELNVPRILRSKSFIIRTTLLVIFTEAAISSVMVHFIFGLSWMVSIILATSFATIGEAVLLPILDEFKLTKTKLGQTILSIGVLDDVVEVVTIVALAVILGRSAGITQFNIWVNLAVLIGLFAFAFVLTRLHRDFKGYHYKDVPSLFLLILFFLFLFVGIGKFVESAALGALLAGIALKRMIPDKFLKIINSEIKTVAYGFFAPVFFLWVGLDVDIPSILKYPLLIVLFATVTYLAKATAAFFSARKELGNKKSIILGISLCVRLSTSIVVIKLLFDNGLIGADVYSVMIGTQLVFKFLIPFVLSNLITRWNMDFSKVTPSKMHHSTS